jgi:hypothetical protein
MKMNKFFLLFPLVLFSLTTKSQWNTDSTIRNVVANSFSYNEEMPREIPDMHGGMYVTWLSAMPTGGYNLMGQHFDSTGQMNWGASGKILVYFIGYSIGSYQLIPDDSSGGILIWNGNPGFMSQRFDENGDTLFLPRKNIYNKASNVTLWEYFSAKDTKGGCILMWREENTFNDRIIKELRMDRIGNLIVPAVIVMDSLDVDELRNIAVDDQNGVYYFFDLFSINYAYYGGHTDSMCINSWSSPVLLSDKYAGFGDDTESSIFDVTTGGSYFTYKDSGLATRLQYIDVNGTLRWNTPVRLNRAQHPSYYSYDKIISDQNGGVYHASIFDKYPDSAHATYIIKRLDSSGNLLWNSSDTIVCVINRTTIINSIEDGQHQIVPNGNGGIIITWEEYRNNTICIYAQNYNSSGNKQWQLSGYPVITASNQLWHLGCSPTCDRMYHQTVLIDQNSVVCAWNDIRSGNSLEKTDIYIAKVDGLISTSVSEYIMDDVNLFPNPATESLTITGQEGKLQISITDATGKVISIFEDMYSPVKLNLMNYSNGIYFLKINSEERSIINRFVKY